jgi:hypothetical protein
MALHIRQFALRAILIVGAVLIAEMLSGGAVGQNFSTGDIKTIVFVCLHGSVNSQMAAAYFNRAAKERVLPYVAVSRGVDLHRSVPVRVLDGLALDGLVPANSPHELTPGDAKGANKILAFDAVPDELKGDASVTYWSGVPLGINDYEAARIEIVRRIDDLIPTLTAD